MDASLHQRIRERAYQIWESEGHPPGQEDSTWLRAEREVLASVLTQPALEQAAATKRSPKPRSAKKASHQPEQVAAAAPARRLRRKSA